MAFWLIIPAAGGGIRFKKDLPKQYYKLKNKTILEHTLECFWDDKRIKQIIIPIASQDKIYATLALCQKRVQTVLGGKTRAHSVLNALNFLKQYALAKDWVLIHDAVRFCLHPADLNALIEAVQEDEVGGLLATPVVDTLKSVEDLRVLHTLPRAGLWQAQTPQLFRFQPLLEAVASCVSQGLCVTDEAFAIERQGYFPKIVQAKYPNPKLTYLNDLPFMSSLLFGKENAHWTRL